jgi:hypothetical protein
MLKTIITPLLLTGAIAVMTACPLPAWAKGSLFVVITQPEPQVQAMAMILTQQALGSVDT